VTRIVHGQLCLSPSLVTLPTSTPLGIQDANHIVMRAFPRVGRSGFDAAHADLCFPVFGPSLEVSQPASLFLRPSFLPRAPPLVGRELPPWARSILLGLLSSPRGSKHELDPAFLSPSTPPFWTSGVKNVLSFILYCGSPQCFPRPLVP